MLLSLDFFLVLKPANYEISSEIFVSRIEKREGPSRMRVGFWDVACSKIFFFIEKCDMER